jgi:ABC-2 type transport system permease protein
VNALGLALRQVPYEQRSYWRNPASAFFTFAFPIMFLVIFASLNTGSTIDFLGGLAYNQFYIPGIIAFGVISACYTNLATILAVRRDAGILKRLRGTPLPASSLFGGLLGNSAIISVILVALTTAIGVLFYDVTFPGHWLALAVALAVGALAFSAIGIAVASLIPNADAAPAVVNGVFFPILFLSGVFIPLEPDSVLSRIADFFPVRHFVNAVFTAFDPRLPHGPTHGFDWPDVGVLALWGLVAGVLAVRRFRWEPRRS